MSEANPSSLRAVMDAYREALQAHSTGIELLGDNVHTYLQLLVVSTGIEGRSGEKYDTIRAQSATARQNALTVLAALLGRPLRGDDMLQLVERWVSVPLRPPPAFAAIWTASRTAVLRVKRAGMWCPGRHRWRPESTPPGLQFGFCT